MPLFVLSRLPSSLWVSRTGSASDWCALQEALYKCIDTIQYNTMNQHFKNHLANEPVMLFLLLVSVYFSVLIIWRLFNILFNYIYFLHVFLSECYSPCLEMSVKVGGGCFVSGRPLTKKSDNFKRCSRQTRTYRPFTCILTTEFQCIHIIYQGCTRGPGPDSTPKCVVSGPCSRLKSIRNLS